MKILVIGGCGFIGSHIVEALGVGWDNVVVYDRARSRLGADLKTVTYVRGELGNRGELESVIATGFDTVIHLVSSTIPQTSNDDPIFDVQMNLVESIALFEICVKHRVKKIVFISSGGTVYGVPDLLPIPEDHPTNPICSYGIVKLAIEKYLQFYQRSFGLEYVILRLSNPYGIRQDPSGAQGAVPVFMWKMMQGKDIHLWGDGTVIRDFVSVKDVARLCAQAARSDAGGIYNVGSGIGTSINDLIRLIGDQLGIQPVVHRAPPRQFDVPSIVLDCRRAQHDFGWKPKVHLSAGLREVASWLRGHPAAKKAI